MATTAILPHSRRADHIIILMTVSQVVAGVVFTIPEIVGPIAGFAILGLFAIWVVVALLRHIEEA